MIKLPINSKYTQPNNSDLFGSLWYTKNVTLDEEGYIKLSSRSVSLKSEKDDANMETATAFGRQSSDETQSFFVVTTSNPYEVSVSPSAISVTEDTDTGNPTLTTDSHGVWFHNYWVVTDDNDFFVKDVGTGTYTDKGDLTSGNAHPLEVFKNKDRLCIGDGNTVKMYSESGGTFTLELTLTLPSDFEVVGLKYANYSMGIITRLSDTVSGQNQDAYFFVWNGSDTSANQGIPTGSDKLLSQKSYQGTFAVLTRAGQLKHFSGGSLQALASMPFYYQDRTFDTSSGQNIYGDAMEVEGDVIYFRFPGFLNAHGDRYEITSQNNPGGVLCYDPNIGIYHRYSASISPASMITVTSANVNTTTNIMTATAGTIPSTGSPVKYTSDKASQIGGLKTPKVYYCIRHTSTTFSLAETEADAHAGNKIDLTSTGASNNYFLGLEVYDFGQSQEHNSGAIALMGTQTPAYDHIIFGADLNDFNSTSNYNHINITVPGFENRGYFVTPKITASGIEDTLQEIYVSYRPLKTNDEIRLKYKDREILGLPVSTPQRRNSERNQCSWAGANSFTTTADLEIAKDAFNDGVELECEVIAGAGAGVLVRISNITENAGTYTVTLSEDVEGAASGRKCDVIIDNWTELKTYDNNDAATTTDTGNYKEFPISLASSWYQIKGELRGSGTAIRELKLISTPHKK
jgi:hypothetical protein